MRISNLHTFLTLVECSNFTEAADRLYCSQPAVSMQIQALEQYFGAPLFNRIGKKLYLTQQGEQFKVYAEQILNLTKSAKNHIQQMNNLQSGTLSIGASGLAGVYILPQVLSTFKKAYPGIDIDMKISFSKNLAEYLSNNETELLICAEPVPLKHKEHFISHTFYKDKLIGVASPQHHFVKDHVYSIHDLQKETFLLTQTHSATFHYLKERFDALNVEVNQYIQMSNIEAVKQGIIHQLGISIVSKVSVQQELDAGLLQEIQLSNTNFERNIKYVYHKDMNLTPAVREFIRMMDETFS